MHWLHWYFWFHLQRGLSWAQLSDSLSRMLLVCHFKHYPFPNVLSLFKQLCSDHLPACIHLFLEPLVAILVPCLHPCFLDHLKTPLVYLLLHILFRLIHFPTTVALVIGINSEVLFVGGMIKQLVKVSIHAQ